MQPKAARGPGNEAIWLYVYSYFSPQTWPRPYSCRQVSIFPFLWERGKQRESGRVMNGGGGRKWGRGRGVRKGRGSEEGEGMKRGREWRGGGRERGGSERVRMGEGGERIGGREGGKRVCSVYAWSKTRCQVRIHHSTLPCSLSPRPKPTPAGILSNTGSHPRWSWFGSVAETTLPWWYYASVNSWHLSSLKHMT